MIFNRNEATKKVITTTHAGNFLALYTKFCEESFEVINQRPWEEALLATEYILMRQKLFSETWKEAFEHFLTWRKSLKLNSNT